MTHDEALGKAAAAWCKPATSGRIMDPPLVEEFAKIMMHEVNLVASFGSLRNRLQKDSDYARSWFDNLEICIKDAGGNPKEAATRFMKLAFNVERP